VGDLHDRLGGAGSLTALPARGDQAGVHERIDDD
jgi:hypothetical protein